MVRKEPPFPNDINYIKEIEANIGPNRRFPFVQLMSLVQENLKHLATLNPKGQENNQVVHQKLNFKCHLCSEEFAYQVKLTYHLKNDHPEVEKPFACSVCPDFYKTCKELNFHLGTQHLDQFRLIKKGNLILADEKKYKCPQCSKKFTCTAHLKKHISSHTKEQTHICHVCGSKYRHAWSLQEHKLKKNCSKLEKLRLSKVFECDHCEVAVTSQTYLTQHMRIYHGIKTERKKQLLDFTCLFCGYKAPNCFTLERHNRTHTGERPFQCKACTAAFSAKHNLHAHIRTCEAAKAIGLEPEFQRQRVPHSTITTESDTLDAKGRFKCSNCNQTFKRNAYRDTHEKCHGDKFMCQFCPAGFKNYIGLKYHEIKMHPKQTKTFKCLNCETAFFSPVGLQRHKWECSGQKSTKEKKKDPRDKVQRSAFAANHNTIFSEAFSSSLVFECEPNLNKNYIGGNCTKAKEIGLEPDISTAAATNSKADTEDTQGGYKCAICNKKFKRSDARKKHEAIHGNKFMCQSCPVGFETQQGLKQHKLYLHPEHLITIKCNNCQNVCVGHKTFETHQSNCIGMDEGEAGSNNLEIEVKHDISADPLSLNIRKFQCHRCPQKFIHKSQLLMHSSSHNNLSNSKLPSLKCHICSKGFIRQSHLSWHLTRYHKEVENRFPCSLCSIDSYKTSKDLNVHLGTQHPDEFQLRKEGNLVYINVKKHQCPHCPKKFVSASKLKVHIPSHSDKSRFICDRCGSKYRRVGELRKHKSNCHPVINNVSKLSNNTVHYLICVFCGYLAPSSFDLKFHKQTCPELLTSSKSIINEIQEKSQDVGLEDEIDIKYEIPFLHDDDMDSNNSNLIPGESETSISIDSINCSDPLAFGFDLLQSDYNDVIPPTTVFKMEY